MGKEKPLFHLAEQLQIDSNGCRKKNGGNKYNFLHGVLLLIFTEIFNHVRSGRSEEKSDFSDCDDADASGSMGEILAALAKKKEGRKYLSA